MYDWTDDTAVDNQCERRASIVHAITPSRFQLAERVTSPSMSNAVVVIVVVVDRVLVNITMLVNLGRFASFHRR